jgi:two-component system LytT family response regulator
MKIIKTKVDISKLKESLLLSHDDDSNYCLIENGMTGEKDLINIYFDPNDITKARNLLIESGYYATNSDHILGKNENEFILIQLREVIYIEGLNNDTYIHTNGNEYTTKQKLYELEQLLYSKKFIRVSKSYIVSVNHIIRIKPTFNGKLILKLKNNIELEVSRHYIGAFRKYLGM